MGTQFASAPRTKEMEDFVWEKSSSKFNYVAGYFSNGAIVTWLFWRAIASPTPLSAMGFLAWFAAGLFFWTFLEYWLHRVAYHLGPKPLRVGHELHHEHPKALLGVPYYATAAIYVPLSWALSRWFAFEATSVMMGAIWLGYIGYCAVHHSAHHWLLKVRPLKQLRNHHLQHHHHWDKNFGMVSTFWDKIFGTSL